MKDFSVALDLLRHGNSGMMRELHPELDPVFDLIEEQREDIGELLETIVYLKGEIGRLEDEVDLYK